MSLLHFTDCHAQLLPFVGEADSNAWIAAIDRLDKRSAKIMVGGHGDASRGAAADLRLTREYLVYLREKMGATTDALDEFDEACKKSDGSRFSHLPAFHECQPAHRVQH